MKILGAITTFIILFTTPFVAFSAFDQANYNTGDTVLFEALGDEQYLYVWYGTDSLDYNFNCNNGDSLAGFVQIIPADTGDCAFDTAIVTGTETGAGSTILVADLPDGTYYWLEPDPSNTCNPGAPGFDGETYNECEALGDYFAVGSFTVNAGQVIGSGFGFFAQDSEAKENTSSQLASAVQSNMDSGVIQTTLLAISVFLTFYIVQKLMFFFGYAYDRRQAKRIAREQLKNTRFDEKKADELARFFKDGGEALKGKK